MTDTVRLNRGRGPEVTVPPWIEDSPTPEQWLEWFLWQSREAQLVIADYHLTTERTLAQVATLVSEFGDGALE